MATIPAHRPPKMVSAWPWLRWLLAGIFVVALALRWWRMGQINTLVFDEIYYPVFANRYLLGDYVYNSHPPLSQYLIAVGIWLGSHLGAHLPIGQELANGLTGSVRSTWSYRWFNAIAGAWIPVILGLIATRLSGNRLFGAIAALIALLDGLFLVESRFGLNNIYLILFGLLSHLFLLLAMTPPLQIPQQGRGRFQTRPDNPSLLRWQWLTLAGICLGCTVAVKWNGLGFGLALYGLWLGLRLRLPLTALEEEPSPRLGEGWVRAQGRRYSQPIQIESGIRRLSLGQFLGYFVALPLLVYGLLWMPHLWLNPELNLWQLHRAMVTFHGAVGSGAEVHPYCSPWYSWPLMARPVAYFYSTAADLRSLVPAMPPLPHGFETVVYAVHAMGNPLLWWCATGAIALMLLGCLSFRPSATAGIWRYCLWGYGANLLPWALVSRCTFLYHYMSALVFAQLALAYWIWQAWEQQGLSRAIAVSVLGLGGVAFWFWLPIYLGLPLTPEGYQLRMWFAQWI
ncbi:MAG: phospholipid carrier-dependent glycosyltransferase [Spirulinaceae cyanobacterium]